MIPLGNIQHKVTKIGTSLSGPNKATNPTIMKIGPAISHGRKKIVLKVLLAIFLPPMWSVYSLITSKRC